MFKSESEAADINITAHKINDIIRLKLISISFFRKFMFLYVEYRISQRFFVPLL